MTSSKFAYHTKKAQKFSHKAQYQNALTEYQKALEAKPDDHATMVDIAGLFEKLKVYTEATRWYEQALTLAPDIPDLHLAYANALTLDGKNDHALELFQKLEAHYEDNADFLNRYGALLMQLDTPEAIQKSITYFKKAIAIEPGSGLYHNNIGIAYSLQNQWVGSIEHYKKAERTLPDNPQLHINMANVYFLTGDLKNAWAHYAWRHHPDYQNAARYETDLPWWTGESLADKTILITIEQGLGDQLIFTSCLPEIIEHAKHVIIEAHSKLVRLMSHSFPTATVREACQHKDGATAVLTYDWIAVEGYDVDFFAPIGTVFGLCRQTLDDYPMTISYISVDHETKSAIHALLQAQNPDHLPLIGLSWRSGLRTGNRNMHYTTADVFAQQIAQTTTPAAFVNLQYQYTPEEIRTLRLAAKKHGHVFIYLPQINLYDDLYSTAALIDCLDIVISVRNTQYNLAGALGKKVLTSSGSIMKLDFAHFDPVYPSAATINFDNTWAPFLNQMLAKPAHHTEIFAHLLRNSNDVNLLKRIKNIDQKLGYAVSAVDDHNSKHV